MNYKEYSILIPYEVLEKIGLPEYIQLLWKMDEKRIVIRAATEEDKEPIDIPKQKFDCCLLALPAFVNDDNPVSWMNWGDTSYADPKEINGAFMVPDCFHDEDEDEDDGIWEDEEE